MSDFGNTKSIPEWERLTKELEIKFRYFKAKLRAAPVSFSPGVNLFYALTFNVDVEYILKSSDDYEIYSECIRPLVPMISKLIDPVISTARNQEIFINGIVGENPTEMIIPIYRNRPMLDLPFGRGWEAWEKVKCVRILDHDSIELVSDMLDQKIHFENDRPSYMVIGIDIPTMLMCYIKWVQKFKNNISIGQFIKNQLFSSMYSDLHTIWMLNMINMRITSDLDSAALLKTYNTSGIVVPSALKDGLQLLDKEIDRVKRGAILPEDFLSTKWLNGKSVLELNDTLLNQCTVPPVRQYEYQKLFIHYKYLLFCLNVYKLYPKSKTYNNLKIKLKILLRDYEKNQMSDLTRPLELRDNTQNKIEKIMTLVTE